jgi:hypothetical protein
VFRPGPARTWTIGLRDKQVRQPEAPEYLAPGPACWRSAMPAVLTRSSRTSVVKRGGRRTARGSSSDRRESDLDLGGSGKEVSLGSDASLGQNARLWVGAHA